MTLYPAGHKIHNRYTNTFIPYAQPVDPWYTMDGHLHEIVPSFGGGVDPLRDIRSFGTVFQTTFEPFEPFEPFIRL